MAFSKKKTAPEAQEPMNLDDVMKKFDRESNIRVWEGTPKIIVTCILAVFNAPEGFLANSYILDAFAYSSCKKGIISSKTILSIFVVALLSK